MKRWVWGVLFGMLCLTFVESESSCITVAWVATGDDGHVGRAAHYDIRYATHYITENNWAEATQAYWLPTPGFNGDQESVTIGGLEPNIRYYFGIKACDEQANWSPLSDIRSFIAPPDICEGQTGNIDCSPDNSCNLIDITLLIDHVYITRKPLCCPREANVTGDPAGMVNLADITYLVDHLYLTRQPNAECQ